MPSIVVWQDRLSRRHQAQRVALERERAFRENRRPQRLSPFEPAQSRHCPDPTAAIAFAAQLRAERLPHGDERAITVTITVATPELEPEQLQLLGVGRPQPEPEDRS